MSTYLLINIAIIVFPLLLSFDKKVAYWRRWPALALAILCGGTLYVVWDVFATSLGKWAFNPVHVFPLRIAGLPLEEILFFITVPYSTIFIFECLSSYFGEKKILPPRIILIIAAATLFLAGILFYRQIYTGTVLMFCALIISIGLLQRDSFLASRNFWIYMALSYVPFVIFNHFLTSIPVVIYNSKAIWNIRFWSIPLEDFFYSFSMLAFYIMFYGLFRNRFSGNRLS